MSGDIFQYKVNGKWQDTPPNPPPAKPLFTQRLPKLKKKDKGKKTSLKNPFAGRNVNLTESTATIVRTARFFKRGIFGK
jgi:hypothetical protein